MRVLVATRTIWGREGDTREKRAIRAESSGARGSCTDGWNKSKAMPLPDQRKWNKEAKNGAQRTEGTEITTKKENEGR